VYTAVASGEITNNDNVQVVIHEIILDALTINMGRPIFRGQFYGFNIPQMNDLLY